MLHYHDPNPAAAAEHAGQEDMRRISVAHWRRIRGIFRQLLRPWHPEGGSRAYSPPEARCR